MRQYILYSSNCLLSICHVFFFFYADSNNSDIDNVPINIIPINFNENKTNSGDPLSTPNNISDQR